jgi:hypothetical protein
VTRDFKRQRSNNGVVAWRCFIVDEWIDTARLFHSRAPRTHLHQPKPWRWISMCKRTCLSHFRQIARACTLSIVSGVCAWCVTMLLLTAKSLRSLPPCECVQEFGSLVLTTDSRCERGGVCVRDCLVVSAQAVCKHSNPIQVRMRMGVISVDFTRNVNQAGACDCQTAVKECVPRSQEVG